MATTQGDRKGKKRLPKVTKHKQGEMKLVLSLISHKYLLS